MKEDTKKWIEKFKQEVIHIQNEFTFFGEDKIEDYYNLKVDEKTGRLTINISKLNELPKQIADRISEAFIKSKT